MDIGAAILNRKFGSQILQIRFRDAHQIQTPPPPTFFKASFNGFPQGKPKGWAVYLRAWWHETGLQVSSGTETACGRPAKQSQFSPIISILLT